MKELINKIEIAGKLVKKDIEEFIVKKTGEDAIGGKLIIRTSDNSEHEINIYSNKYKKDENKKTTSELSYFYKEYTKLNETFKDVATVGIADADVISINEGVFVANDFLDKKNNKVISTNKISAKFINKVEEKDIDTTLQIAKFEVEGIIESIEDESIKDVATGNLVVKLNAIRQNADGFGKDAKYEVDSLIPIKLIVGKDMATGFRNAGYYVGCFAKFAGSLINTKEIVEKVEKQAFGEDIVSTTTNTLKKYEIKSGSIPSTIFDHELDQMKIDALVAKRKQALVEIKSGVANTNSDTPFEVSSTPAPAVTYNPFAQK